MSVIYRVSIYGTIYHCDSVTGFWVCLSKSIAFTRSPGATVESFWAYWHGHALHVQGASLVVGNSTVILYSGHPSSSLVPLKNSATSGHLSLLSTIPSPSESLSNHAHDFWSGFIVNGQLSHKLAGEDNTPAPLSIFHRVRFVFVSSYEQSCF